MANNLINPAEVAQRTRSEADQPMYEAGALAERKRLHDAFRRIAGRYQDQNREDGRLAELVIRRAIEEVFEAPIPWQEEVSVSERKPRK